MEDKNILPLSGMEPSPLSYDPKPRHYTDWAILVTLKTNNITKKINLVETVASKGRLHFKI
jgi:hypothetical protein